MRLLGPQQPLRPALTCAPSSPKTRSGFPARKLRGEQSRPRTRLCPHVSPSTEHALALLRRDGKYLILGLEGSGKRTLLNHLQIGDVEEM